MILLVPKSLYWRIQLWYAILLFVVVGGLLWSFVESEKNRLYTEFEESLVTSSLDLHSVFTMPPPAGGAGEPRRGRPPEGRMFPGYESLREINERPRLHRDEVGHLDDKRLEIIERVSARGHLILASIQGQVAYSSERFPKQEIIWKQVNPSQFVLQNGVGYYRRSLRGSDHVIIAASDEAVRREIQYIRIHWYIGGLGCVCLSSLFGGLVLKRSLRPITHIREAAQQIEAGQLDARIGLLDPDSELGHLSADLNQTFSQLEKVFQQQVKFTSDASHEMRTPLTVIRTKAQWALRKERSVEEYKKALQMVDLASKRMQDLTQDLLDLSRLDSGEKKLKKSPVSLAELIQSQVYLLRDVAIEKGIEITHEMEDVTTVVDQLAIEQVMINLLSNAIKYNKQQGSIHITLSQENNEAIISVEDTGLGMTKEQAQAMFNRFYQADIARSEESNGLGLAIVKSILDAHEGDVEVFSELGVGSKIVVKLPCNTA